MVFDNICRWRALLLCESVDVVCNSSLFWISFDRIYSADDRCQGQLSQVRPLATRGEGPKICVGLEAKRKKQGSQQIPQTNEDWQSSVFKRSTFERLLPINSTNKRTPCKYRNRWSSWHRAICTDKIQRKSKMRKGQTQNKK